MTNLIVATRNAHKVEEIRGIMGPQFQYLTLRDFPDAPPVNEDANSFAGNAAKKAVALAHWLDGGVENGKFNIQGHAFVVADDSGLEVDALNGAPGVHSARFAAPDPAAGNSTDAENNDKLLRVMRDVPDEQRTARFRCVIALTPIGSTTTGGADTDLFNGACEGRIIRQPNGAGGFGYDPLFVPIGYNQSFAELGEDVKNRISHRAKALAGLRKRLLG